MNEVLINEVLAMPEVTLVGVTKKHTKEEVDELAALGVTVFGENRVQDRTADKPQEGGCIPPREMKFLWKGKTMSPKLPENGV